MTEFDQNNIPDYLGYHLHEDFENWYATQKQKIVFHEIQDLIIATDGIFTFMPVSKTTKTENINLLEFLLFDKTHKQNDEMLSWQLKSLEFDYDLKPADDFAMIRVII